MRPTEPRTAEDTGARVAALLQAGRVHLDPFQQAWMDAVYQARTPRHLTLITPRRYGGRERTLAAVKALVAAQEAKAADRLGPYIDTVRAVVSRGPNVSPRTRRPPAGTPVVVGFDGARDTDALVFATTDTGARRYWLHDWTPTRPADTQEV